MSKRILAILVVILALLGGGYYYTHSSSTNKATNTTKTQDETKNLITTTLKITDGTKTSSNTYKIKKDSTVLELMQSAQKTNKIKFTSTTSSYGVLIDSINNTKNDTSANKYWSLYVNDKLASQGAGTQKITNKDTIEWKFQSLSM